VNSDAQVPTVPQTEQQGGTALVFDEAVGGWGKKRLSKREPVAMVLPTDREAQNLLSVPGYPAQFDGCRYKRRDPHMTITSVATPQDKEETRLNQLRAEREREKQMAEQELRERNKKKPPLRLLSLGMFDVLLVAGLGLTVS